MKNSYMEDFSHTNIVRIANIVSVQGAKAPIKFAGTGKAWLLEWQMKEDIDVIYNLCKGRGELK